MCTRFAGHLIHPNAKDPLKHFDELRRRHWYDADDTALTPPTQPR